MFTLLLSSTTKFQIEAPYGNRISFVVVKLLKDSVSETPAYRPFSLTPKSDNHFGMECNRIIPTSHRHSNRLTSALLTVCLLRLPPLGSYSIIQGESWHGLCFFALSATYLQNNRLYFSAYNRKTPNKVAAYPRLSYINSPEGEHIIKYG